VKFAPGYGKWPECVPVVVTKRFDLNPIHWVEDGVEAVGDLAGTAVNAVIAPVKLVSDWLKPTYSQNLTLRRL
jgi:hypothetical protein